MKALSIRQPWAWLIVMGYKDIENRNWHTFYRGKVLIHASQKFDDCGYYIVGKKFPEIQMPPRAAFEKGGIVGECEVIGCADSREISSRWYDGLSWGFILANAKPLTFKPCKGKLGFFELPEQPNQQPRKDSGD